MRVIIQKQKKLIHAKLHIVDFKINDNQLSQFPSVQYFSTLILITHETD